MEWNYYNHAMLPNCAPHEIVDTTPLKVKGFWKSCGGGGTPLLARWTTDFDCGYETDWWYVIKDDCYDISTLKSKRRYEITKGRKNFFVQVISPMEYGEQLYEIQVAAFSAYPEKYRPKVDRVSFLKSIRQWEGICFGAFIKDGNGNATKFMCGYSYLKIEGNCIHFSVQKTNPQYERDGVNAALVDGILQYFNEDLTAGKYICDGARSINHETAFQEYLEKYFGFRKAYCKLNILYRPRIRWLIPFLYVCRKAIKKFDNIGVAHLINSVLNMEEIRRKCKKTTKAICI